VGTERHGPLLYGVLLNCDAPSRLAQACLLLSRAVAVCEIYPETPLVDTGSVDIYVAGFVVRCDTIRPADQLPVRTPGAHGLLPSTAAHVVRLLVTDDRAYDILAAALPDARAGLINVFAAAERCAALVDNHPAWEPNQATAMVCGDLQAVPALPLPSGLTLRPVKRLAADPADGVPLQDAVAAAMFASPASNDPPDVLADYLRSLPPAVRLLAAVDGEGIVRATSAYGSFGTEASVMFVNTHPDWRRRGIGQAMTAAAPRAAQACGARRACLDASNAGTRNERLGFETVTRTTRFFPARAPSGL